MTITPDSTVTDRDKQVALLAHIVIGVPLNAWLAGRAARHLATRSHRLLGTPAPPELRRRDWLLLGLTARGLIASLRPAHRNAVDQTAQTIANTRAGIATGRQEARDKRLAGLLSSVNDPADPTATATRQRLQDGLDRAAAPDSNVRAAAARGADRLTRRSDAARAARDQGHPTDEFLRSAARGDQAAASDQGAARRATAARGVEDTAKRRP